METHESVLLKIRYVIFIFAILGFQDAIGIPLPAGDEGDNLEMPLYRCSRIHRNDKTPQQAMGGRHHHPSAQKTYCRLSPAPFPIFERCLTN
jgi:hypothetical protein